MIEIDTAGVAELFGVSRAHATNRITKMAGFPPASTNLSQRLRRWRLDDVQAFKAGKRWSKTGRNVGR